MDRFEQTAEAAMNQAEQPHEWRLPDPIIKTLPEVEPLHEAMLPNALRAWIVDEAKRMNCPIDFVAIPALVLAGSLIGNRCNIRPKKNDIGWLLPANLWGGVVGRPSVLKSPAKNAALRPLKPLEARAMEEHAQEVKLYRAQEASYKAISEAIKNDMKALASSGKKAKPTDTMLQLEAKLAALEEPLPKPLKRYRTPDAWGASQIDGGGYVIGFTSEGYEVFCDWYDSLTVTLSGEDDPLLQEHFGKYRSLMPKLALIFHVVEGEGGNVSASSARKAAAWCAYLESHARRIYSLGRHAEAEAAQVITRKLSKGELADGFTVRDIRQKGWALLKDNQAIESTLELLTNAGWIHPQLIDMASIGRPTTRYNVNPLIRGQA